MGQEPTEQCRALASAIRQDLRNRASIVVIDDRLRLRPEEREGMDMAVQPGHHHRRRTCQRRCRSIFAHVFLPPLPAASAIVRRVIALASAAASVSRWRARERAQGDPRPKALGGDRRSGRIDACKGLIPSLLEEAPDITIQEMRQALAARGHVFGFGTIQRFFKRHRITRKKRPRTPVSRTVRTS